MADEFDKQHIMHILGRMEGQLLAINQQVNTLPLQMKDMEARLTKRLDEQDDRIDGHEERIRNAEIDAARKGSIFGLVSGVGTGLILEGIKALSRVKGGG